MCIRDSDYIIPLIRNSRSVDEAKQFLTGNFTNLHEIKNWKGVSSDKTLAGFLKDLEKVIGGIGFLGIQAPAILDCLFFKSDAAAQGFRYNLGGSRIFKKKKNITE